MSPLPHSRRVHPPHTCNANNPYKPLNCKKTYGCSPPLRLTYTNSTRPLLTCKPIHSCKRHVTCDDLSYSPARPVNLSSPIPITDDPPLILLSPLQCSLPIQSTACKTSQRDVQQLFTPPLRPRCLPIFPVRPTDLPPYRAMRRHAPTYSCHEKTRPYLPCHEKTRPYLLVPCEDTPLPTRAMRRHALLLESRVRKTRT